MITEIRNGTVIDCTGAEPKPNSSVLIENGRIREVGSTGRVKTQVRDAQVIEANGRHILPGLMDMHTHLCKPYPPEDPRARHPDVTPQSLSLSAAYGLNNARNLIAKGVTTVRDLGSHGHSIFAVQTLVDSGQALGPRIIASGQAITTTGGHARLLSVQADGPAEVRRAARIQLGAGAGSLKFMASGSGAPSKGSPHDVHLTQEELAAGISAGKDVGKTAAVHSINPTSTRNAVLAGADSIEHGVLLDESSLALMRDRNVSYVPTVWTYHFWGEEEYGGFLGTPNQVMEGVRERSDGHHANVSKARELGIVIVAGTDSALPVNPPSCLIWELEWLVRCDLTASEALQAATLNAARLIKSEADFGTLEPGKVADVVIVEGNPLEDVRNLEQTVFVLKGGEVVVGEGVLTRDLVQGYGVRPGPFPSEEGKPKVTAAPSFQG